MLHDLPVRRTGPGPEPAALRPGEPRTIGPFRVRSRLGSGGMGDVYLGATRRGQQVAIKLIRGAQLDDDEFRTRFRREVRAAAQVRSRFIANLVDADPDADLPWLATEYVAGPTLSQELAANGPLPQADVLNLVAGVAEALYGIHRAGLVHRDVKPANVILGQDGPRLIDLGVVAAVDATRLTLTGQPVGTPMYMAPEQATGSRATSAVDVWALGALAYYAATGNHLFEGDHPAVVLYRVSSEEPSYADSPAYLRPFLDGLLSRDPEQRPSLDEILRSLGVPESTWSPVPAGGHGRVRAARRDAPERGRRRVRGAVGGGVAAVVLAASAFGLWQALDGPGEREEAGGTTTSDRPSESAGAPEDLVDPTDESTDTGDSAGPAEPAGESQDQPWALGSTQRLGEGSCWIVSVDAVVGRQATLTISCDQAGTAQYGTPTPSQWLTVSAVGQDGTTARGTAVDAGPDDTFFEQGNLTDPADVTLTVTLPDVGELARVSVRHTENGYGGDWAATP
ncbi:serine/threonine-protein kinase [Promicromonospora sukumoe]|uniref:serine/threonine-protein kinase n=1 Tax=Promicromonospora sukumoe TaxID=88382 RepID=UPI0037C56C4C